MAYLTGMRVVVSETSAKARSIAHMLLGKGSEGPFLASEHNNHLTIKTFITITAERDAAIRECNMALEEHKRAFAERDMAITPAGRRHRRAQRGHLRTRRSHPLAP
ncbi:GAGA-binding transcriptional activator [Striga asiatica]|uniref:GAGA-binding transcriptional activator n=1 Tax=Striga asiatica TaxID=4170 RepID=A0A5A7R867_STRAF|nr:GAGA-binding transcriptional activator [Striga asiatica]